MEKTYDCEKCDLTVTFKSTNNKAIGNASYEDCHCPQCGAVLGEIRDDWGMPTVVGTVPRAKKA